MQRKKQFIKVLRPSRFGAWRFLQSPHFKYILQQDWFHSQEKESEKKVCEKMLLSNLQVLGSRISGEAVFSSSSQNAVEIPCKKSMDGTCLVLGDHGEVFVQF